MGSTFTIMTVETVQNMRLRLYGRAELRDQDISRGSNVDPTGSHGVIIDVLTTSNPRKIYLSPMTIGANVDDTYSNTIYYTINNTATSSLACSASAVYLVLEQYP